MLRISLEIKVLKQKGISQNEASNVGKDNKYTQSEIEVFLRLWLFTAGGVTNEESSSDTLVSCIKNS